MTDETIPQSQALSEVEGVDSLAELMNRQPPYQPQVLDKIIRALRDQRVNWQKAEAAGKPKASPKGQALLQATARSVEDLGL